MKCLMIAGLLGIVIGAASLGYVVGWRHGVQSLPNAFHQSTQWMQPGAVLAVGDVAYLIVGKALDTHAWVITLGDGGGGEFSYWTSGTEENTQVSVRTITPY